MEILNLADPTVFWGAAALAFTAIGGLAARLIHKAEVRKQLIREFFARMSSGEMKSVPSEPTVENFPEYRSAVEQNYMRLLSIFIEFEDCFEASKRKHMRSVIKSISTLDQEFEKMRQMQNPPGDRIRQVGGDSLNQKIEFLNDFMGVAQKMLRL